MGSSFTSFDSSSAYLVGSQFSGEDDKESNQDRVLRSASALLQASQLDVNSTSGTEQQWLGRAHGYTLSDPFLGFTPHDNTTAARNAWQYTQLLDSGFAGASAQDEYIGWHPRVPQFHIGFEFHCRISGLGSISQDADNQIGASDSPSAASLL
ncbi:hypothetical protein BST61_g3598 [Cercospora zeina]